MTVCEENQDIYSLVLIDDSVGCLKTANLVPNSVKSLTVCRVIYKRHSSIEQRSSNRPILFTEAALLS